MFCSFFPFSSTFSFFPLTLFLAELNIDGLVKSLKRRFSVIPAKAGIQSFQLVISFLDSRFRGSDDFLRVHQCSTMEIIP